jgi:arabinogalactan oligomer / maltooligosaccharide transport system permease protein
MDLANARSLLPPARSAVGGFLKSWALLSLALVFAGVAGWAGLTLLRALGVDAPAYVALVIGTAGLAGALSFIARRFAWIMPWYYVLPSIVFLATFTFFPVGLTIYLAFTDYAGARNGQLSIATTTEVTAVDGRRIAVADAANLACAALRNGCVDVRAVLESSEALAVEVVSYANGVLTLAEPLPRDREPRQVSLYLPDLGFDFSSAIADVDGREVTLVRPPPFPPDLEQVIVRVSDEIERVIVAHDGVWLTLDEAPPVGFEPSTIARYNEYGFIGWRNFTTILARAQRSLIPVFTWNITFAVLTIVINTAFGVLLAVLLNNPDLRFRNLYRTLLILPWALPNIITIQVWRGFLNENFGAINRLLMLLDVTATPVNWLGDPLYAKAAILLVNLWLGLPFMMTAVLGALSAIPREIYEAARIDGANPFQAFWGVTAPLLRTALVPITLTGFAFNFNNFNIVFLLTDGGPPVEWGSATARGTDILISWAYNEAFRSQGGYAYGLGSAISILIFVITIAVSLVNFRVTGALKEGRNT